MRRFLFLAVLTVILYWVARALFRRFFPRAGRARADGLNQRSQELTPRPRAKPKGADIDYAKVRDTRYRDLKK